MYPILLSVGRINIYSHGLLIAIGAAIGGYFVYLMAKRRGLNTSILFDVIVYSLLGGLVGARLLYLILYPSQFSGFIAMISIWYGGLVSFGGIVVGLFIAWAILKAKKEPVAKWLDIGIIGLFIGWAFGRIGCFLNGDGLGIISQSKIAILGRIPTQIFESIWALLTALMCFYLLRKKSDFKLSDGAIFWIGIGSYGLGRFIVDFFLDENKFFLFFKPGQIGSLVFFLIALIISFYILRSERKKV